MNLKKLFVVVPSMQPSAPIKGAVALCNGLVEHLPVILVPLKPSPTSDLMINPRVQVISLADYSWRGKYRCFKRLLCTSGTRDSLLSLSLCFSADFFNSLMKPWTMIFSSVRGDLVGAHRFDYQLPGLALAFLHYRILRRFDQVIAMSDIMKTQLESHGIKTPIIVGNFIDEPNLMHHKIKRVDSDGPIKFLFLARMAKGKCPDRLIDAMFQLKIAGLQSHLDMVGDGPMRRSLESMVRRMGLESSVTFHGYIEVPYKILQQADYLVLPSESEGIPRSILEALFFGVPCIARNIGANREIIKSGWNGELFNQDSELVDLMIKLAKNRTRYHHAKHQNLLPVSFQQKENIQKFIQVLGL